MLLTWCSTEFPTYSSLWCNPFYKALQNPEDKHRSDASTVCMEINKAVCLWVTLGDRKMICHKAALFRYSDSSCATASRVLGKRQILNRQVWVEWGPAFVVAGPGITLCIVR